MKEKALVLTTCRYCDGAASCSKGECQAANDLAFRMMGLTVAERQTVRDEMKRAA